MRPRRSDGASRRYGRWVYTEGEIASRAGCQIYLRSGPACLIGKASFLQDGAQRCPQMSIGQLPYSIRPRLHEGVPKRFRSPTDSRQVSDCLDFDQTAEVNDAYVLPAILVICHHARLFVMSRTPESSWAP